MTGRIHKVASLAMFAAVVCGGLGYSRPVQADCFDQAAAYQGINVYVLRAIAIQENPRCDATIRRNTNGSVDVGCMQINSIHTKTLASHGVAPAELLDQCKNVFVGAWHYKRMVRKYGNTWLAVGAYHSETPHLRDKYAQSIRRILRKYGFKDLAE